VRAVAERFDRGRPVGGVIRIRHEADDRHRRISAPAIEQRELGIDARAGAAASARAADAYRDVLGEHDVQNAIVRSPSRDALPDWLVDLRIVDVAADRFGDRQRHRANVVPGHRAPRGVLSADRLAGDAAAVDDDQDVRARLRTNRRARHQPGGNDDRNQACAANAESHRLARFRQL
jgi:hypothetical protein